MYAIIYRFEDPERITFYFLTQIKIERDLHFSWTYYKGSSESDRDFLEVLEQIYYEIFARGLRPISLDEYYSIAVPIIEEKIKEIILRLKEHPKLLVETLIEFLSEKYIERLLLIKLEGSEYYKQVYIYTIELIYETNEEAYYYMESYTKDLVLLEKPESFVLYIKGREKLIISKENPIIPVEYEWVIKEIERGKVYDYPLGCRYKFLKIIRGE